MKIAVDHNGKRCAPSFHTFCGIEVELKEDPRRVDLLSTRLWQELPSNGFYCPAIASIAHSSRFKMGTFELEVRDILRLEEPWFTYFYVFLTDFTKPKRGGHSGNRYYAACVGGDFTIENQHLFHLNFKTFISQSVSKVDHESANAWQQSLDF